ncbi:MAG TPA: hypothetical protein PK093_15945 [Phycisphaerae bacterium]|nr:hypothetical protein [Phycisphaerae bacterium]
MPDFSAETLKISLPEWSECTWESDSRLRDFSLDSSPSVQAALKAVNQSGQVEILEVKHGLIVKTKSHVGRIRIGGLDLTIRPKLPGMKLAALLRYAYGLRDLKLLSEHTIATAPVAFHDLLALQLYAEASELVARGLFRKYQRFDEDLASPRGRLNIQSIARRGGGGAVATLPCIHHPRSDDCLINRVVLSGLELAAGMVNDPELRLQLRSLSKVISESVTMVGLHRATFRELERESNRLTAAYRPAIRLIQLLVESRGITLQNEDLEVQLSGFLFDMNSFFQQVISRFLREFLVGHVVLDEVGLKGMMAYVSEFNPQNRKAPSPRPDFVILKNLRVVAILDAKYRDLWEKSLPRDMLYQLAMYAMGQADCHQATILYPTMDATATESRVAIFDPVDSKEMGRVGLRPVRIDHLADLVSTQMVATNRRACAAFASSIVFA